MPPYSEEVRVVPNFRRMNRLTRTPPVLAVVREIDVFADGGRVDVFFSRVGGLEDVSLPTDLSSLLRKAGAGTYQFSSTANPNPVPPITSPISVNNRFYVYMIYVLTAKNWQFSSSFDPFTVESSARDAYFKPTLISRSGAEVWGEEDCMAAYFITDADAAAGGHPQGYYDDRINIHVDLIFRNEAQETILMPIIIDPDVRHPGGVEP